MNHLIQQNSSEGSVCAIAADSGSTESFCYLLIHSIEKAFDTAMDNGHCISPIQTYIIGSYLQKDWGLSHHRGNYYTVSKDKNFVYKESVRYPYVNIEKDHKGKINTVFIKNVEYIDLVQNVEHISMAAL